MKKIATSAVLAAFICLTSLAADNSVDRGMESFVYPGNMSASVDRPIYAPDGLSYLSLTADNKRIVRYDSRTGKEMETVMDVTHTRETSIPYIESFILSPEGLKLLVSVGRKMIYRRSSMSKNYV